MINAIIFDFFDVIHDDPFHKWLRLHGLQRDGTFHEISELVDKGSIDEAEFYKQLAQASGQTVDQVQAVFSDTGFIDWDLVAIIEKLKTTYTLGLLSNASGGYLRPILEDHSLTHLFDAVVISGEVQMIKPSQEVFELILSKLVARPSETIFVDDNPKNIAAAERLGIQGILYTGAEELQTKLRRRGI